LHDLEYRRLVTEVGFWGRDGYLPTDDVLAQTATDLDGLLARAPRQPDYLSLRASVFAWQAYASGDVDERIAYSNRAMQSQYAALRARPAHRHAWLKMVQYASRATTGAARLEQAERRLHSLGRVDWGGDGSGDGSGDGKSDAAFPRSLR
jgi:hypothetical protein